MNRRLKPGRLTSQRLMPSAVEPTNPGQYDLYPVFPVAAESLRDGYRALAELIMARRTVVIDGYIGVYWEDLREAVDDLIAAQGQPITWINVADAMKPESDINVMIDPFLGGDDPIFGTRFTGRLENFFDRDRLHALAPRESGLTVLYGCGSALAGWDAALAYVDVPKNELQFRSRAGSVTNLGAREPASPKSMYKRFYFVDWVVLNLHKRDLVARVNLFVDEQRPGESVAIEGDTMRDALTCMSRNFFRVRPWFEPGPWGGQWIKEKIPQLPQDPPNYAWSFELIVPENGLVVGDGSQVLEVSFDWLMFHDARAVLGAAEQRFGVEFPIRFDFLDTFDGGNLSLQCHPRTPFIQEHFGETFTQDETYYILDCEPGAEVYLGFNEDADLDELRTALERSISDGVEVDVRAFVNTEPAHKHDLFLIPSGTIHCSGVDNLVLEISATPYIFTFKMYDWLRLDLEGQPRPLNLDRAFANLKCDRRGSKVREELVSHPREIAAGDDWRIMHLPTHREHFYDVERLEFDSSIACDTNDACHIMSLVDGVSVILETAGGMRQRFNYAETFVVPAAAGSYRLLNEGEGRAMVVRSFVKPDHARHALSFD